MGISADEADRILDAVTIERLRRHQQFEGLHVEPTAAGPIGIDVVATRFVRRHQASARQPIKKDRTVNLTAITETGHFTKVFDPNRRIPEDVFQTLTRFLHSTPTSVNAQVSHFVVAADQGSRSRIAGAIGDGFGINVPKLIDASHVIVFATRQTLTDAYLDELLEKEELDGKFADGDHKQQWKSVVRGWIDLHRYDVKDLQHWMEKQTYLALGMILMAAAEMGVDATPLEGFEPRTVDAALGLRERGLTATVLLALGYRSESDFNVGSPKSRLSMERHFTFL